MTPEYLREREARRTIGRMMSNRILARARLDADLRDLRAMKERSDERLERLRGEAT